MGYELQSSSQLILSERLLQYISKLKIEYSIKLLIQGIKKIYSIRSYRRMKNH